jgi:excinuclease ABC A subunit
MSSHDLIRVVGARENTLRDITVEIPKRRLTVVTGVSGSGKSSLVFDTVAAESQRLINETYSAFLQGFMTSTARPDVDLLDGLTAAIVVGQERLGANPRSTVGTVTDALALLRIIFSKVGVPHVGPASAFSFNLPSVHGSGSVTVAKGTGKTTDRTYARLGGMCPRCDGTGRVDDVDVDVLVDQSLSLAEGAIQIPGYTADGWLVRVIGAVVPLDVPVRDLTPDQRHDLLFGAPRKVKVDAVNLTVQGLVPKLRASVLSKDVETLPAHMREFVSRAATFTTCPGCDGTRLNETARSARVAGTTIAEASAWQVSDLAGWVRGLDEPSVGPILTALGRVLDSFVEIGLGYLSLDRASATLSGGEAQRTAMVRHLGSALTDVTYVFDEPTAGLHPHDVQRMNGLLASLRDKGNTVLVVEHEPATILVADHVIDLGPGAGRDGGQVVYAGDVVGLRTSGTLTGQHLADRARLRTTVRTPTGALAIRGAADNNLRDVDVDIPLGVLVAVTGVAGSGKSSLVDGSIAGRDGVVVVDQGPIRGSRRSNPATYTGLLDPVRTAFAKANGVRPALFSPNSDGACPACRGAGVIYTDLAVAATVATRCEECDGKRFEPQVLEHRLAGRDIAEVLAMSVVEAQRWAAEARIGPALPVLDRLADVGLGYVSLGQPLTTLSGGERQRLRLAAHLGGGEPIIVLDEPTTGLHLADVTALLALLDRLVDAGRSVVVVEHDLAVVAHADWVVDLGPGAGHEGGRVVFQGTPAELAAQRSTLTGQHLADQVA